MTHKISMNDIDYIKSQLAYSSRENKALIVEVDLNQGVNHYEVVKGSEVIHSGWHLHAAIQAYNDA